MQPDKKTFRIKCHKCGKVLGILVEGSKLRTDWKPACSVCHEDKGVVDNLKRMFGMGE